MMSTFRTDTYTYSSHIAQYLQIAHCWLFSLARYDTDTMGQFAFLIANFFSPSSSIFSWRSQCSRLSSPCNELFHHENRYSVNVWYWSGCCCCWLHLRQLHTSPPAVTPHPGNVLTPFFSSFPLPPPSLFFLPTWCKRINTRKDWKSGINEMTTS